MDAAYELAARMRAREEASKARERELEFKARASEEERKMVDLVVQEYADLVRNLEGRKSVNHTPLVDTLQDAKSNLHKILTAFSTESDNLHATIAQLNAKVSDLQMTLDAERITASHDRTLLSQAKTELDKLELEDQTAAKMVARYMSVPTIFVVTLLIFLVGNSHKLLPMRYNSKSRRSKRGMPRRPPPSNSNCP